MDPTERFADLVAQESFPLDLAALLISAHAEPGYAVDRGLASLDQLAAEVTDPDVDSLLVHLFGEHGFIGNQGDYYDPRNSYLHEVLERRRGIPISLSVLLISVGARVGVRFEPISAPGHFLTRVAGDPDRFVDAFAGGRVLARRDVDSMLSRLPASIDRDAALAPATHVAVVRRMLANLIALFGRIGHREDLIWATRLTTLLPGVTADDIRVYAEALARGGDFAQAARIFEDLAEGPGIGDATAAERDLAHAHRIRSRLN